MKKIYVAMAVLATVLLSSCVREKNFKDIKVGENELAFVMQGAATRSAEEAAPAIKGVTIPVRKVSNESLYLEETIEYLNPDPATKGAPAYTVTLPDIYPSMGVYAEGKFGDAVFTMYDQYGEGWRYNHNYNGSPWPDNTTDVAFYLRMPASGGGVTMGENYDTFELTSPENGLNQKDLLFGQITMNKEFHDSKLPGGAPVTMKHALTGIKFRNGHLNNNQTKTIITKVEIVGLNGYGKGTIGADGVVTWSDVGTPSTTEAPFYLEFENPTYNKDDGADNPDGTVTEWDEKLAGTTWGDAADDHNLNHANGELTFWFIPQEITNDLVLNIEFRVKTPDTPNGTLVPHTIELGKLLNAKSQAASGKNLTWGAGQLRTYTLKPYDVDVEIEDTITATEKSNLHIANTGNVDEYVRMLIMGNWYGWKPGTTAADTAGVAPSILVGYKYKDAQDAADHGGNVNDMVAPWFRSGDNGTDPYGHFDTSFTLANLGDRDGKRGDWADASGGFYYTLPIGPGAGMGEGATSATKDLFESYTVTSVPTIYLPSGDSRAPAAFVHLVMEIVIQAIPVPTETVTVDGEEKTRNVWWLQAWYDATGVKKLDPEADRNEAYKEHNEAGWYTVYYE